ncbi:MAG TPA: hypothetical protein VHW23_21880 [Kofleriaceae bacterium]|jgi:hypothetical protein|nr:hypothetical protein [Kofleriaceae bacterium]
MRAAIEIANCVESLSLVPEPRLTQTGWWPAHPGHANHVASGSKYGEQNLENPGQTLFLGTGPASGSAPEPMSVGEVAWLWLYAHGDTSKPIATLQVTGRH